MGRHSRGSGEPPAPLPDPPARHPYAPRSVEDSVDRDRQTYRVVDAGPPAGSEPPPYGGRPSARVVDAGPPAGSEPPRYGGRPSAPRESPRPSDPRGLPAPDAAGGPGFRAPDGFGAGRREPRFGATRADLADPRTAAPTTESRRAAPTSESRFVGPTGESRFRASTAGPAEPPFGGGEPRFGATRADLVEPRFGGSPVDSGESRLHAPVAEPGEARFGRSRFGGSRFGADESRLPPPPAPGPAPVRPERPEPRFGATRADLHDPRLTRRDGPAEPRVDLGDPRPGPRADAAEPRFGATRVDLAESVGSTALAPRRAADPDEVTDTGARRARSAFRLATEDDEDDETGEAEHDAPEDEHDHEHEPALLLQWAIFVAQTLTGAVAGIGVWLGFYRLWSTWPFYAVPAVGVAAIATLVLARTLRRRHGRDLDLLTAVVTAVVITVLTVLPAAFTLQGLTQ